MYSNRLKKKQGFKILYIKMIPEFKLFANKTIEIIKITNMYII